MSEQRVSHLRLRRIRYKDGRTLDVLRSRTKQQDRVDVEYAVRRVLDGHDDRIAGMAFVVWTHDGASTADVKCYDPAPIPKVLVPDFVRERLRTEIAERFTRQGLKDDGIL